VFGTSSARHNSEAVVGRGSPKDLEAAVIEFLGTKPVLHWAEVTLGL